VVTFDDLFKAYKSCRQGKKPSNVQTSFELKLGKNLSELEHEINTRAYRPSPYRTFIVTHPKPREIFAANFRDRVVHHLIVSRLEPIWENKFYHGSFACRKGRGTHGALKYCKILYNRISEGGTKEVWVLQLDIASFFITISRPILKELLLENIKDEELSWLVSVTFDNDPRVNASIGSSKERRTLVPLNKSLFGRPTTDGLPIGNLTSQFGANVYLNALDHYISRKLRPQGYFRYMDDLTLLDTNREKLEGLIQPISEWLKSKRGQDLHPLKTTLKSLQKDSIELLGYRLLAPKDELIMQTRKSKQWAFVAQLREYESKGLSPSCFKHTLDIDTSNKKLKSMIGKINSHLGLMKHSQSYQFRKNTLTKFREHINDELDFLGENKLIIKGNFSSLKHHKIKIKKRRVDQNEPTRH
jgi:RNA-directed DNA polymerase